MKRLLIIPIAILIYAATATAQQRPLLTDDIDITPPGSIEVSIGADFFQRQKFPLSGINGDVTRLGTLRVRTGFASNFEFEVEGAMQNYVSINSRDKSLIPLNVTGNSTHDFDDFIVSGKIKLRNETRHMPGVGFKFGFQLPNSNQENGIGTNQINVFGKVIVQKRFGDLVKNAPRFTALGNIGLGIMTAPLERFTQNDVLLYGLAGIYRLSDAVNIVSEVNGRMNTRSGAAPIGTESQGQFRLGAQIKASGLRFDTAAAFGLTRYSPRTGLIFGVTYQSPNIFTPAK